MPLYESGPIKDGLENNDFTIIDVNSTTSAFKLILSIVNSLPVLSYISLALSIFFLILYLLNPLIAIFKSDVYPNSIDPKSMKVKQRKTQEKNKARKSRKAASSSGSGKTKNRQKSK